MEATEARCRLISEIRLVPVERAANRHHIELATELTELGL